MPLLRGDFSLNAANVIAAAEFLQQGLQRLAPTHDLNASQIQQLALGLGPEQAGQLECVVHQHLPVFHTEHCVFCRFLSDGNSYQDCGHPCEENTVHLRDSNGADHLVLADMGCRNTVFNAKAQSGAHHIEELRQAGVRHFRIELVDEPASKVVPLLEGYAEVLAGTKSVAELWGWMETLPDANGRMHGVTSGSLENRVERDRESFRKANAQ
ncbi:hypothetical protein CYMTET_21370 [Cymbomonas tetramitiformis]|uniref:Protease n=1 Tax=Cymbomonas tetramitiformis TaxID=36881 RepID=A0AAE0G2A4_9CHLO|nr:hypothetical protein CYMTET_21370 [Cymbomonas tetramitiformis]